MRWLLRMLIFWAISAPLFYVFGLPVALDHLNKKTRKDAYSQCITHLTNERMMGGANSPMSQTQGTEYCHCVSDGLTVTQNDLLDLVQKKEPAALTAASKLQTDACNSKLQGQMYGATPSVAAPQTAPAPAVPVVHDDLGLTN